MIQCCAFTDCMIWSIASGGVVQWVARLTRNVEVLGKSPAK